MLVVGSKAMQFWGFDRTPRDLDVIGTMDEYNTFVTSKKHRVVSATPTSASKAVIKRNNVPIEFEFAWEGSTGEHLEALIVGNHAGLTMFMVEGEAIVAPPEALLAIKESHKYLRNSPHFEKTWTDIHELRAAGHTVPAYLKEWLRLRKIETYDYGHPKLNVSKEAFFTDDVPYEWDHDSLHEAIKTLDKPAYQYFKVDGEDVLCSKEKFFAASLEVQLASVYEESCVLALERCLVPTNFKTTPEKAFGIALQKVCTSITSGWWRAFAWENYMTVKNMYSEKFVLDYVEGLCDGTIKKHAA